MIEAVQLNKTFRVADKAPHFMGTLRHLLHRKYREIPAVAGVNVSIRAGEVVGFLGPNGAGKTTTLKMMAGLLKPTSGSVRVAGFDPFQRASAYLRQITLVMGQRQQLIWDLPPWDSFRINAAVYDIPWATAQARIKKLAEMLDVGGQLTQPVRKLSLGQRMKAELLAALLHEPKILFLDEPTLGLDVNAQLAVRNFLKEYNRQFGATILLTSHYMADITALCQRVLIIHHGKLLHDGGLDDIVRRFAPYREIKLDLHTAVSAEKLAQYGQVSTLEGNQVCLLVPRADLPATVDRVLAELPVADMSVGEPPVDQVIGQVFAQGAKS